MKHLLPLLLLIASYATAQENVDLKQAQKFFNAAAYDSAKIYYERAVKSFDRADRKDEAFVASLGIANSLMQMNKFEAIQNQIDLLKKKYPQQAQVGALDVLMIEAELLRRKGNIDGSVDLYDSISKMTRTPLLSAKICIERGFTHFSGDDLKNAQKAQLEAITIVEEDHLKDSSLLARLWDLQGHTSWHTGDFATAIKYFQKSVELRLPALGDSHPEIGSLYGKIGIMYKNMMQYDKALEYYSLALDQRKKFLGPGHLEVSHSLNNIGYLLYKKGLFDEAMQMQKKALQIRVKQLPANHRRILQSIEQIGLCYGGKGDFDRADSCFRKTLAARTAKHGHNHHQVGYAYYNLGAVAVEEKDYRQAADYFQTAIAIGKAIYGPHNYDQADNYNRYANCLLKLKDYDGARTNFQLAAQNNIPGYIWNKDPYHLPSIEFYLSFREALRSLVGLANSFANEATTEGLEKALPYLQEAERLIDTYRLKITSDNDLVTISSSFKILADCANRILYKMYEVENKDQYKNEIFRYAELAKASALQNQLSDEKAKKTSGIPEHLLERERWFRNVKDSLSNHILSAMKSEEEQNTIDEIKAQLFEQNRAYEAFVDTLEETFPTYATQKFGIKPISIAQLQQTLGTLDENTHLIQYHVFDEGDYLVSLISRDQHVVAKVANDDLAKKITALRQNLDGQHFEETNKSAAELYQALIDPIAQHIEEESNLVIIPDGLVGFVPFDILQKSENEESYLMLNHVITYDFSATLFTSRSATRKGNGRMLAVAPEFEVSNTQSIRLGEIVIRSEELVPLPGAKKEVETLRQRMNGDFLVGKNATEAAFKSEAQHYDILHLATHSLVNEKDPDFSKLVFAPDEENDGSLHSFELANIDLKAQLVTLSACNTGIGKIAEGEGVMSLARSFRSVGVPSVVMSLWPASDRSTPELMQYFYQNLKEGQTKDVALNNARKQYLKTATGKARHPFYWGGFVLIGDNSSIKEENSNPLPFFGGIAVILIVVSALRRKKERRFSVSA